MRTGSGHRGPPAVLSGTTSKGRLVAYEGAVIFIHEDHPPVVIEAVLEAMREV
jgi:hypothetical protein